MSETKAISVRINHETWKKAKIYCVENDTTLSGLTIRAIQEFLENHDGDAKLSVVKQEQTR